MQGFREPNTNKMDPENRETMEKKRAKVFYPLHAFGGMGRAVKQKFGAIQVDEIIAHTQIIQSRNQSCEISCMAADAGLIETGVEAIAIDGSGGGADSAMILIPSNTHRFFDMKIREVICKPR